MKCSIPGSTVYFVLNVSPVFLVETLAHSFSTKLAAVKLVVKYFFLEKRKETNNITKEIPE